ncbi:HlyD family secretion protein, partial [Rhodopseudomonas palustris]|uniref:HlyD family secretion protein n=2 Tax=Rhodopseudomonas TaxID=1073 RepID=UPI000AC580A7
PRELLSVPSQSPNLAAEAPGEQTTSEHVARLSPAGRSGSAIGRGARRALIVGVLALGGAGLAAAYAWYSARASVEQSENAYVRAEITTISPKVQGYVSALPIADNEAVTAGQVLVRIDDADFRARLSQAEANVAAAQAGIEAQQAAITTLDSQTAQQRNMIAQADAAVMSAEAEVERAQLDYTRYETLLKLSAAPRQRLEAARADLRKATAALAGARAAAAAERGKLDVLASNRKQAEAGLQQARASLEQADASQALARIDLANTVLRAPVDGVVGARSVRLGALVQPGTPLLSIVPLDRVWVVANFKETQIARMRPGQAVIVRADSFPGVAVRGHIDSFSPASGAQFALLPPDNATGNFVKVVQRIPVKIAVDAGGALQGRLRAGMSASVDIDVGSIRPDAASAAVAEAGRP